MARLHVPGLLVAAGVAIALTLSIPSPAIAAGDVELVLSRDGNRPSVTLTARDASLGQVLDELARAGGFRVYLPPELAAVRGNWELRDIPLDEALRRIVEPHSMLLSHETPAGAPPRLAEVQVLAHDPAPSTAPAAPAIRPPPEPPMPIPAVDAESAKWAQVLETSEDMLARSSAVAELERLGTEAGVRALEAALSDRDVTLRKEVVEALGRIASDPALMSLGRAAIGDPAPEVRQAAVDALAANPGERSGLFLREAARDRDPSVRESALRALGSGGR